MSDTLKQFWSEIVNVENASPVDIQSDILAYLEQIERLKEENQKLKNPLITSSVIERLSKEKKELEDLIPTLELENRLLRSRNERFEKELEQLKSINKFLAELIQTMMKETAELFLELEKDGVFDKDYSSEFDRLRKLYEKIKIPL